MTVHASFIAALLFASACAQAQVAPSEDTDTCTSQLCELTGELAKLNLTDPVADLERNLKSGDRRFVSICGYSCVALGADEADEPRSSSFGTRRLRGTSCVVEGDAHSALIDLARNYARSYNGELLRRIRARLVT